MKKLLFITWDGPQVSYLEGLFYPILEGLQEEYAVHVIQFTWGDRALSDRTGELFRSSGMRYTRIDVGPRAVVSIGIFLTMIRGIFVLRSYIRRENIDIILFRSTYPGLMALLLQGRKRKRVFDTDGLPLEEKVDFAGLDPRGLSFRWMKMAEGASVRRSHRVLVRSMKALTALPDDHRPEKFRVVLNGRDAELFKPPAPADRQVFRRTLGVDDQELLLAYCGSLGAQYCFQEMIDVLDIVLRRRRARLMLLTGSPEYIDRFSLEPRLRERLLIYTVPPADVPLYLGAADAGLAIRKVAPSTRAVSPVKLGEYLLCGLPVVASPGIGDSEDILRNQEACLLLGDCTPASLEVAAGWLGRVAGDPRVQASARKLGLEKFGLSDSILSYRKALEGL